MTSFNEVGGITLYTSDIVDTIDSTYLSIYMMKPLSDDCSAETNHSCPIEPDLTIRVHSRRSLYMESGNNTPNSLVCIWFMSRVHHILIGRAKQSLQVEVHSTPSTTRGKLTPPDRLVSVSITFKNTLTTIHSWKTQLERGVMD